MNLIIPHANKTMQMPCRVLFVCMLPLCFTSFWPAAHQNSCHIPIKKQLPRLALQKIAAPRQKK